MDYEVELNYRLTAHLGLGEKVLATMMSTTTGIYAATDRRILFLSTEPIGYRLRVLPYTGLESVDCLTEDDAWSVRFNSRERRLAVNARSEKEARRFAAAVSTALLEMQQHAV